MGFGSEHTVGESLIVGREEPLRFRVVAPLVMLASAQEQPGFLLEPDGR